MFVEYGPIGDGAKWRVTRGTVTEDCDNAGTAYQSALRMANGNKGKLRRTIYAGPLVKAPKAKASKKKKAPAKKKK